MVSVSEEDQMPGSIWHYTTASGLEGILRTGSIYATDIQYLNDSREWRHITRVVLEEVGNDASLEEFSKLLTRFEDGVLSTIDCYVACFCMNGDLLNQWRGYSGGTGGFSIELDPNALVAAQAADPGPGDPWSHSSVIYKEAEQREFIREKLRDSLPVLGQVLVDSIAKGTPDPHRDAAMLAFGLALVQITRKAPRFKAEAFETEEEWRMFKIVAHDNLSPRLFRQGSFGLTPYIPLTLGTEGGPSPIRGVVVGPNTHPDLARKAAHQLLLSHGHVLDYDNVTLSNLSYR
jgi:hypothetical protein